MKKFKPYGFEKKRGIEYYVIIFLRILLTPFKLLFKLYKWTWD
jgi:hypothetical protein